MAGEEAVNIDINSRFDAAGVTQAQRGIVDLNQSAQQIVAGLREAAAAAGVAETEFLAMAGAASTAALATGDAAKAEQILAAAMGEESAAAAGAAAATEGNTAALGGLEVAANSAKAAMGELGIAMGAVIAVKIAADLAETGAQAQRTEARFDSLAVSAHTTGEALLSSLRAASGGEIADSALELDTMKASLLGVGQTAAQLTPLLGLARDRAQQMGITTEQAFDRLVTGLGRGSAKILDDLGIVVHITQVNDAYAASIGKTTDQLTDAEKKQALVNEVMRQGAASAAANGGAIQDAASQIAQGQAAFTNLKESVGGLAAIKLGPLAADIGAVANAMAGAGDIGKGLGGGFDLASKFNPQIDIVNNLTKAVDGAAVAVGNFVGIPIPDTFSPLRDSINQWLNLLGLIPAAAAPVVQSVDSMEQARERERAATNASSDSAEAYRAIEVQSAADTATGAAAQMNYANSLELAGVQARAAAMAAQQKADADQVASVNAQTHAIAEQLLAEQARIAAGVLLGTGAAGANAAAQLAGSSQQVDVLTAAYYRLAAAQAAANLANAKTGINAAYKNATQAGGQQRLDRMELDDFKHTGMEKDAERERQAGQAAAAARRDQVLATGNSAAKIAILQKEYNDAARLQGAGSAAAINAQTKLLQAQEQGSAKRASGAGAAGEKISAIEEKTGDKIAQIVENTQKKITAIDEREAAKQAAALRKLNEDIATMTADRRASNEADDLDLVGVKDAKEAAKLNDRERAEADARRRETQAQSEARAQAEAGDAESAQKTLGIREEQINDQQALDEKYYARQRELAGDPANEEALKKQYDEATRANEEAAQASLDIAKAEADQKKAEVQAEKDAVVSAANEQANQVIAAADRSMGHVKKATGEARAQGVADLHAIGDAVNAIPTQKTITITVNQQGTVGAESTGGKGSNTAPASSGNKAAGGGSFMTSGKTNLTVGDNPGGREIVTVTPVGGKGQSHASGNMVQLAGGGTVLVDAGGGYTTPIAGTGGGHGGGGTGAAAAPSTKNIKDAVAEQKAVVELLKALLDLRDQLSAQVGAQPFNMGLIRGLAQRAAEFVQIVEARIVPTTKEVDEGFKRYADVAKGAIDILAGVANLRHQLQENIDDQPFNMGLIHGLANRAAEFVRILEAQIIPASKEQAELLSTYADMVRSSVGTFKEVAALPSTLFDGYISPSNAQIAMITNDAKRIAAGFFAAGKVMGKDGAAAGKAYAEGVGAAFGAAKDGLLVIAALQSGDFVLPKGALAQFQSASLQVLDTMRVLGHKAATIPKSDIAALQTTTAAIAAQSESLIKLAAVPFGDLPGASASLGAQANRMLQGGGGNTFNIYGAPGMDVNALANAVITKLNQQTGARR